MRKYIRLLAIVVSILFFLVGCGEGKEVTEAATPEATETLAASPTSTEATTVEASPTPISETPTSTPTTSPSFTPSPTMPTATPTATATSELQALPTESPPTRIQFTPGATSARVTGNLDAGGSKRYVLRALGGQTMEVALLTPSSSVRLSIWGADGTVLKAYDEGGVGWRGKLPSTQDYFLEVSGPQSTSYTLEISILPLATKSPIRVISPKGGERWLEGETYDIVWRAPNVHRVNIGVALGGKDRGFIAMDVPASEGRYTWTIPAGFVSDFGIAESNAVRLRVSSSANPGIYDENDAPFTIACPRIRFAPGTTSETIQGRISQGERKRYVLGALAGQEMEVSITSPNDDVLLSILGVDGTTLIGDEAGQTHWRGTLPATQEYFITLSLVAPYPGMGSSPSTDYTLEVRIPAP